MPRDRISEAWPAALPFIMDALEYAHGKVTEDDIRKGCESGEFDLWMVIERGEVVASVLTELVEYPRKRVCRIYACAGKGMREWLRHFEHLETWARDNGCDGMELVGREGWRRVFPKWRHMVMLETDLD